MRLFESVRLGRTACRLQWLGRLRPSVALPNQLRVDPHAVVMIDHAEQKQASLKKELEDRVNMAQNHTVAVDDGLSILVYLLKAISIVRIAWPGVIAGWPANLKEAVNPLDQRVSLQCCYMLR